MLSVLPDSKSPLHASFYQQPPKVFFHPGLFSSLVGPGGGLDGGLDRGVGDEDLGDGVQLSAVVVLVRFVAGAAEVVDAAAAHRPVVGRRRVVVRVWALLPRAHLKIKKDLSLNP